MKPIPYGLASYKSIREKNSYYLDKTHYIPQLESVGEFLFFIRPRRFGKSSWLTLLECYYDINLEDEFDFFFKDTYIYNHPTSEKNSYLILKFNFSQVNRALNKIEHSFNSHIKNQLFFFTKRYKHLLDDDYFKMIDTQTEAYDQLEFTLDYIGFIGHKIYILIDEYDNFANTILSTIGQTAYQDLTHGAGFFRSFFGILKGATDQMNTGIGRMFITGVSPVTMDDVTSGFNIGKNISLHPHFNQLLGFTEQDVIDMLRYYQTEGNLALDDFDKTLNIMKEWYDNYRFSSEAEGQLFNTDMVLYFIDNLQQLGQYPQEMIDQNVKIDYGKLRHLMILDKQLNGNFNYLANIIKTQKAKGIKIANSFPVERLTKLSNFVSLLFYFGLLSYNQAGELSIPNQTVKQLMVSYLREGYEDGNVFNVDMWKFATLIREMAYQGEWQAVFEFLATEINNQTSVRDYLTGEKVIQTFLLAYLSVTDYYLIRTEEEMGKGFVDLYIEPFWGKYKDLKYSYLIELKYISRTDYTEEALKEALKEAKAQLKQYATDKRVIKRSQGSTLINLALVFCGWELKAFERER